MSDHPNCDIAPAPRGFAAACERRFGLLVAVLAVAGLVLRFTRLGAQSLWIDEVLSYGWIDGIRRHGLASLLHDIHGPLHALAIYATSQVSTSEWWLRLPSAVAGTLAIPVLALFGRSLWNASAGLAAEESCRQCPKNTVAKH